MIARPSSPSSARLPGIEALRGIVAICVVLLHLQATFQDHPAFFAKGYLGVDFFLMLSGFFMARTQEGRFADLAGSARFIAARYRRLWLVMAVGAAIGAPTLYLRSDGLLHFLSLAVPNLFLLPVSFEYESYPLNIPAWTIFYELVANALHALLLWRLRRTGLLVVAALLLPVMVWTGLHCGSLDVGARPEHFLLGLPRTLFAYVLGMLLGRWRGQVPAPLPASLALALAVTLLPAFSVASWLLGLTSWSWDLAFVTLACPAMILSALAYSGPARLAAWLGILSFPLFAVHMPVVQACSRIFGFDSLVAGVLALLVGILVAMGWKQVSQGFRTPSTAM